jgi:hypothetical protein
MTEQERKSVPQRRSRTFTPAEWKEIMKVYAALVKRSPGGRLPYGAQKEFLEVTLPAMPFANGRTVTKVSLVAQYKKYLAKKAARGKKNE